MDMWICGHVDTWTRGHMYSQLIIACMRHPMCVRDTNCILLYVVILVEWTVTTVECTRCLTLLYNVHPVTVPADIITT